MTNQNVVNPSEVKLCINTLIAMLPRGAGYLGLPHQNFIKKTTLEDAKVNAWIDSMRAASPTRTKSSENQEKSSWNLHHPSALNLFDSILDNSKGKKIVIFLDYDGTLSPIVTDPEKAFMSRNMRATVKDIARHFPTAIVTGRCRDKVFNFVKLAEVYYAASHGMDIMGPTKSQNAEKSNNKAVLFQPASQFLPMIDEVYKILLEKTKCVPGAMVENNIYCLSVHFRCVEERSWAGLAEKVRLVLNEYPKLRLTEGRKVLEIRPNIKWDKGRALEFLLHSLGYDNSTDVFPIYIGDDRTDEDAFKVLRRTGEGIGIVVSSVPKETDASYTLQDPLEVEEFLRRLVEWKRSTKVTPQM